MRGLSPSAVRGLLFVAVQVLLIASPVEEYLGTQASTVATFRLRKLLAGSEVVEQELSCSEARGIFLAQGSNPCPLHWQAGSDPLCHQGGFHPCL